MNPITQPMILGSSFPDATAVYKGVVSTNTDATSLTYSSAPLGTATPDRVIVVCVVSNGADTSTVTVGGVSATQLVDGGISEVWAVRYPTGTTANVVATFSSAFTRAAIFVYSCYNVINEKVPLATKTGSQTRPTDLSSNVVKGSIGIGCSYNNDSTSFTWTGLTERYDAYVSGGSFTTASQDFSSNETPRTMSVICGDTSPVGFQTAFAVLR